MAAGWPISPGLTMFVSDFNQLSQADCQILHPGTRLLFRHWETVRAERAAPKRDELDLRRISNLLPNIVMIEATRGDNYRWRLAGTDVCHLMRRELTGQDALALGDQFEKSTVKKLYNSVIGSLQPFLIRYRLTTDTGAVIGVEQLGLPLLNNEQTRVFILGGIFAFSDTSNLNYSSISGFELASARTIWTEHLPGDTLVERLAHAPKQGRHLRVIEGGRVG